MTDHLTRILKDILPDILGNLLKGNLGLDGEASESLIPSEWSSEGTAQGEIFLVGKTVVLRISIGMGSSFADRLLRSFVGGPDSATFENDEREDAVAELSNMLAGRVSEALRGRGINLAILHPKDKNAKALSEHAYKFNRNTSWQWALNNQDAAMITINDIGV